MLFPTLVLFTLLVTPCTAQFWSVFTKLKPGGKPIPERPNIDPPAPNNKPKIDTQPVKPPQEQAQANNLAGLKQKVDHIQDIIEYFDAGKDIVDAILGTQSTTIKAASTITINPIAIAPCRSYASLLSSCASATPSFYSLQYNAQASCVCYRPSINTAACQATPTFNASYNTYEVGCYNFFKWYGLNRIAQAMNDSIVLPGRELCSWASTEYSMPSKLPARTVACPSATPTMQVQTVRQGDEAGQLLTGFDRGVLVVFAVTVTACSWIFFV